LNPGERPSTPAGWWCKSLFCPARRALQNPERGEALLEQRAVQGLRQGDAILVGLMTSSFSGAVFMTDPRHFPVAFKVNWPAGLGQSHAVFCCSGTLPGGCAPHLSSTCPGPTGQPSPAGRLGPQRPTARSARRASTWPPVPGPLHPLRTACRTGQRPRWAASERMPSRSRRSLAGFTAPARKTPCLLTLVRLCCAPDEGQGSPRKVSSSVAAARPARFAPIVDADGPYPTRCTRGSCATCVASRPVIRMPPSPPCSIRGAR
jgi:hypothetical protein